MRQGGRGLGSRWPAMIVGLVLLAACGPGAPPADPAQPGAPTAPDLPAAPAPPRTARAPDDLPPCAGINPDIRRPAGSNCLGILPAQCGADAAQAFIGRAADARTRAAVAEAVGHERIRWIAPREAVTDDLRPDRLNIMLDERGHISKTDCH